MARTSPGSSSSVPPDAIDLGCVPLMSDEERARRAGQPQPAAPLVVASNAPVVTSMSRSPVSSPPSAHVQSTGERIGGIPDPDYPFDSPPPRA